MLNRRSKAWGESSFCIMDCPSTFRLSSLPGDLLGHLLRPAAVSYLLIKLWRCGDAAFNRKLAQSVSSIKLRASVVCDAKLPLLLSDLRALRSLSIIWPEEHIFKQLPPPNVLPSLPSSLTSLELAAPLMTTLLRPSGSHPHSDMPALLPRRSNDSAHFRLYLLD